MDEAPISTPGKPDLIGHDDLLVLQDGPQALEALTALSSDALRRDDLFRAYMFADRRCRMARPESHDLLLRSEALRRLGAEASGDRDLNRSFDLDPTDTMVNRLVLASSEGAALGASRWVVADPRSGRALVRSALDHLFGAGYPIVARLWLESGRLSGWAAWRNGAGFDLRIETQDGTTLVPLRPRNPPTRDGGSAPVTVWIDHVLDSAFRGATLISDGQAVDGAMLSVRDNPAAVAAAGPRPGSTSPDPAAGPGPITVIVPVYDDVAITRACLDALAAQTAPGRRIGVVVVDDAAPAPEMKALVADMSRRHGFELITNDRNLGFIGSINRALESIPSGDVMLLNSDIVLPESAIERLAAAARSDATVGIVNPLTNNGQFCSFPVMFGTDEIGTPERIAALDRIAMRVNGGHVVAVPSGNGFCMYVTRACLDAAGPMPETYLRGYYEDVEFSLRARRRGFESVCAPNIYVGHKGSASFKDEKRSLVKRNQRVLRGRFPDHEVDTEAFGKADPLRPFRTAIELEAVRSGRGNVVLAGSAADMTVLDQRAGMLRRSGVAVRIMEWSVHNAAFLVAIRGAGDDDFRTTAFLARTPDQRAELLAFLDRLAPRRVEVAGSPGPFGEVLDALIKAGTAFGFLLCESLGQSRSPRLDCVSLGDVRPCRDCVQAFEDQWLPQGVGLSLSRFLRHAGLPPAVIVAMDPMAKELADDLASDAFKASVFETFVPDDPGTPVRTGMPRRPRLGLLYPRPDLVTEDFIAVLAAEARAAGSVWDFVVLGQGLDDRRLMSVGNVFVTGSVADDDHAEALDHYGVSALLAPQRWSGYGLVNRLAARQRLPKAYFDWSIGALRVDHPDLSIDPRICDRKAAAVLCRWMAARMPETRS